MKDFSADIPNPNVLTYLKTVAIPSLDLRIEEYVKIKQAYTEKRMEKDYPATLIERWFNNLAQMTEARAYFNYLVTEFSDLKGGSNE